MDEGKQTPKTFGQILDQTFRLSKQYFKEFFLIFLILLGPLFVLDALIQLSSGVSLFRELGTEGTFAERLIGGLQSTADMGIFASLLQSLTSIVLLFMVPVAIAATLHGVKQINKGESITATNLIKQAFTRFWPIIGSSFIVALMFFGIGFVPTFLIILTGVVGMMAEPVVGITLMVVLFLGMFLGIALLGVRWGFFLGPVVFENDFPGLSRSWHLSKGRTWKLVGVFIVLGLITNAIQSALDVVSTFILGYSVLQFAFTSILTLLVYFIMSVGFAVVFFDLKVRRDADDLNDMLSDYTGDKPPNRQ